ncbi:MAG: phosphatidylinositol-specific phospholipase C/glycerophosphodiester phosphodiesterase family protein [Fuerstiella sp.]
MSQVLRCLNVVCVLAIVQYFPTAVAEEAAAPLLRAHAHNDYLHTRPLLDALEQGFCSVEADVFLVNGKLLVAHSFLELSPDRTLEDLYLKPLRERVKANGGRVHKNGPVFTLLIDIKADGANTYTALNTLLQQQYADVFSYVENGTFHEQAVNIVISGDRAFDVISGSSKRFAGIDGRLSDLDTHHSSHLMPLISDNWRNHFKWRGVGEFPEPERAKLTDCVAKAHAAGRRIRFWATPDVPAMWEALDNAQVDMINTDDLPGLAKYLRAVE